MADRSPALRTYGDEFASRMLDLAPDAVLIAAADGEIVFVNDRVEALFGYEAEDLLGRTVDDLLPVPLRPVHRADRSRYRAEPVARSMGEGLDLRARRSDGSEFPVEVSLSPMHLDGELFVVAAVRDITVRVAAEDQYRRVVRSLDATDDAVFIFDAASLRFSFVNAGAVRLVGYGRDELLQMTPLHLNPYTTDAEYRCLVAELLRGGSSIVRRSTLLRRDGGEVAVEKTLHSVSVDSDGNRSIITLARDITARLAAEEELRRSEDALREAEQVVALAADRDRIARDLHDTVIQRLFAVGMGLQAALAGAGDPATTRTRLESAIEGLDQTIRDLRAAVFSLHLPPEVPTGMRGRLFDVVSAATDALGTEPRLQFQGPIDTLDGSIADHLLAVLREALSNVAQHAEATHVHVAVTVADDVSLVVVDDGIGVPDDVLGGHGLANMAARAHDLHGEFHVRPRPNGGSQLTWQVPVVR